MSVLFPRILALLALFPFVAPAQSMDNTKFGRVSQKEMEMERYEDDPSAHAVVLFDRGKLNGNTGSFTRHVRIKILSAGGLGYANFTVRSPSKSDIHGITFNLEGGQVVETSLSNDNIFKEEIVDGFSIYKIFMPNVKPGSVVDLRYSFDGLPQQWRFQERIPVVYSEIFLEPTTVVIFKKTMYGNEPVSSPDNMRWIARKVPALMEEPMMCNYSNYLTHFKFDIQAINFPGNRYFSPLYLEVSSSWEKVGERLWENDFFGGVAKESPFLNAKAKTIKDSNEPVVKKIQAAVAYVQENIKWNGAEGLYASRDYWANFTRNHTGNSAEINLFLLALLKKSGINAYAAVMSTRDHGLLNQWSASISSLNYVVVFVRDNGTEMVIDATDDDLVPGILPERCRNISAFVIDKPGGWWIDTTLGHANSRKVFIQLDLTDLKGPMAHITTTHEAYDYLQWIKTFEDYGSENSYIEARRAKSTDVDIVSCTTSVDKMKMKAVETLKVSLAGSDYVHNLGQEVLINPYVFMDITHPFQSEGRKHPIDFITGRTRNTIVSIKIPDGLTLRKVPERLALRTETEGAMFSFEASVTNNVLSIKCNFAITRQIFTEAEYVSLRTFFTEVHRKLSEEILFDRKS